MIDRDARAKVRAAIDDYLNDRVTAFDFDRRIIDDIRTQDHTVEYLCGQLWCIYDDQKDHLVVADKPTWDGIQRIALLLESDAELLVSKHRHWWGGQPIAIAALSCLVLGWWMYPPAWPAAFIGGGVVALGLKKWQERIRLEYEPADPYNRWPFRSFGSLRAATEMACEFRKQRFRHEIAGRQIRSKLVDSALKGVGWLPWIIFSPLFLLAQAFPITTTTVDVVIDGAPVL